MDSVRSALSQFAITEAEYKITNQSRLLEREVRYGAVNPLNVTQFTRLKRYFSDLKSPATKTFSHDYRAKSGDNNTIIRRLTYFDKDGSHVVWQSKRFLQQVNINEYNTKVVLNEEKDIEPVPDFEKHQSKQRMRDRISYDYNNLAKIDLTELTTIDLKTQNPTQSYEVEIEYLPHTYGEKEMKDFAILWARIFTVLYDTHRLYTVKQKEDLDEYLNRILDLRGEWNSVSRILTRARNLKLRDMVWGGLVGGKIGYRATIKTDGIRKLLIIDDKNQLWLAYPPMEYNLVVTSNKLDALAGTILDGESVDISQRINQAPSNKYWFLIFDALCFKGNRGIQEQPHDRRIEISSQLSTLGTRDSNFPIKIGTKDFYDFAITEREETGLANASIESRESVDRFYYVMNVIAQLRKTGNAEYKNRGKVELRWLNYKDDGIVFIPRNTSYDPGSTNIDLRERILTKYPDLCKWKPVELITIDLLIRRAGDYFDLYAAGERKFIGSNRKAYSGQIRADKYPMLKDLNNVIVEFAWNGQDGDLAPTRIRWADKPRPNPLIIAIDNWDLIFDPISEDTLCGKTFVLLRRYHNRIKRELLRQSAKGGKLLDIGGGRGGDIDKWSGFSQVITVEPNANNREEFQRRLVTASPTIRDKITILPVGGEDTAIITRAVGKDGVDTVSLMLSMSFFWKDNNTLQGLVNTITHNLKVGGDVIFLTINGNVVKKTMLEKNKSLPSVLQLGPAVLTLKGSDSKKIGELLHIDIKDTIVSNQDEYLVHLSRFYKLLGISKENIITHKADEEKFLSTDERIFSAMFTYGRLQYLPTTIEERKIPAMVKEIKISSIPKIPIVAGDDAVRPLAPGLVRIAVTGQPNNFLHALLKAFYPKYQESTTTAKRQEIVDNVRRELGAISDTDIAKLFKLNVRFMYVTPQGTLETGETILGGVNTVALLTHPSSYEVIAVDHGEGKLQTLFKPI